jgi:hypothetical protein
MEAYGFKYGIMLIAFRILEAIDQGDKVRLKLCRDGIEDPKAAPVLIDVAEIPQSALRGHSSLRNCNFKFRKDKRPKVLVNGVEMFLESLVESPVYDMTNQKTSKDSMCCWVVVGQKVKRLHTVIGRGTEITMVVGWD